MHVRHGQVSLVPRSPARPSRAHLSGLVSAADCNPDSKTCKGSCDARGLDPGRFQITHCFQRTARRVPGVSAPGRHCSRCRDQSVPLRDPPEENRPWNGSHRRRIDARCHPHGGRQWTNVSAAQHTTDDNDLEYLRRKQSLRNSSRRIRPQLAGLPVPGPSGWPHAPRCHFANSPAKIRGGRVRGETGPRSPVRGWLAH